MGGTAVSRVWQLMQLIRMLLSGQGSKTAKKRGMAIFWPKNT